MATVARMQIGNRTQTFERYHFQWSWVISITLISMSRYYSTSNYSKMVQDRAVVTMADHQTDNGRHCLHWTWIVAPLGLVPAYAPLIRLRHMALCNFVLIDFTINRAIFSDLERPLTHISRSRHVTSLYRSGRLQIVTTENYIHAPIQQ